MFDNSLDGQTPKETSVGTAVLMTGRYTVAGAKEAMLNELDKLRDEGSVSAELYDRFRGGSASDTAAGSRPGRPKSPPVDGKSAGQDGARGEGSGAVEKSEAGPKTPYAPVKGDRIRYTAKDGTEKTGVLKIETAMGVRVSPDGGGAPDFISNKKIVGPAEDTLAKPDVAAAKPAKADTLTEHGVGKIKAEAMPKGLPSEQRESPIAPSR